MWSIIEFLDSKEVAVIPNLWLINKTKCYWPNYKTSEKTMTSVKRAETPNDDNWKTYEMRTIKSFGKYLLYFYYFLRFLFTKHIPSGGLLNI